MSSQQVRFGPRESHGWLLGMTTSQLLLGIVAVWTSTRIFNADTSGPARAGWIALAAACLTVAFLPLRGRTIVEYIPVIVSFWGQRLTGHDVYRGGVFRMRDTDTVEFVLPGDLAQLRLINFEVDGSSGAEIAIVHDPCAKTYTGVLALEGSTFALLETSVRAARVDAWGNLLAQLCSEGGAVSRLQVLERTLPDSGDALHRDWARRGHHDGTLQAANYEQLLAAVDGSTQAHECFVAVTIDARRAGSEIRQAGGGHPGASAVVVREIDKITEGLKAAGVRVEGWCSPRLLGEIIRTAYDPTSRPLIQRRGGAASDNRGGDDGLPSGVDPRICGPMHAENTWSYYRTDSAVHRCWWILQWPRQYVDSAFLSPLLLSSQHQRTVSIILEPLSPSRASRRVTLKQSGVTSEAAMRKRFRRRTTRLHEVEATDVDRRESELVAGHGLYRMLGFLSVSSPDLADLEVASGEIESLAQRSQLEITRLPGEHDQAFAVAALPLARGLR
ncbi:SCO6880 family protein [Microlunatus sp. Gsoil 973]|uniref:SCO6880 family protein n=1 Tax=Microlunatus sp. Gsoil 973 TaxID=2672569 RepID=UPI0012B49827|nr:SCO6880 family protein [Microlunatus sp. Gsoil 973]QGN34480.1 PrgI family protein [Microlunatus sp. Gsoil 973]